MAEIVSLDAFRTKRSSAAQPDPVVVRVGDTVMVPTWSRIGKVEQIFPEQNRALVRVAGLCEAFDLNEIFPAPPEGGAA